MTPTAHHWTDERAGGVSYRYDDSRYVRRITGIGWMRPVSRLRWMQARRRRG